MTFQTPAQRYREAEAKERAEELIGATTDIESNLEIASLNLPATIPESFEERVATAMICATIAQAQATLLVVKELWALRQDLQRRE